MCIRDSVHLDQHIVLSQHLGGFVLAVGVDMGTGDASAKAWGCDLTYDYVKINGAYRT